jgi:hypothetical protein
MNDHSFVGLCDHSFNSRCVIHSVPFTSHFEFRKPCMETSMSNAGLELHFFHPTLILSDATSSTFLKNGESKCRCQTQISNLDLCILHSKLPDRKTSREPPDFVAMKTDVIFSVSVWIDNDMSAISSVRFEFRKSRGAAIAVATIPNGTNHDT